MNNSYWWQSLPSWENLAPISATEVVDVAIVGAGYTGLWSAFFLNQIAPDLKISIYESDHVGFGASGRNGGWVSSLWPTPLSKIVKATNTDTAINFQRLLHSTIDDFGETLRRCGISADFQKSGTVNLARSPQQLTRLQSELAQYQTLGFNEGDYTLTKDLNKLPQATNVLAGLVSPHCASIQPAKLVRQLAELVKSKGASIYERSRVTKVNPNELLVNGFKVRAKFILVATEGYGHTLIPRATAPIHSLMFISDEIPTQLLDDLKLKPGVTFNDARNLIIYGQRTANNRIAFGGRGAPYRMGSKTGSKVEFHQPAFAYLQAALTEMFPPLAQYVRQPSHCWGGPIGVSRDWQPSIRFNSITGLITAGNYVGDGVAAAYLAGQTIAELVISHTSDRTNLPWVNHQSRNWEIEPIRYLLINSARVAIELADRIEQRSGRETPLSKLLWRILKG